MDAILLVMILALLIPIYAVWRKSDIWQRMLAFSSIAAKTSIIMLAISVLRDDWSIGVVAVIVLSAGEAGLMLLAHLIKRMQQA